MNKTEFVAVAAEKAGLSKKDVDKALTAMMDTVKEALAAGDKIQFVGFGTWDVKERPERIGHNPRTKEEMTIPASREPRFKAGKTFKDAIAK